MLQYLKRPSLLFTKQDICLCKYEGKVAVHNKYNTRYDYQSTNSNVQEIALLKIAMCRLQTIPKVGLTGSSVRFEILSLSCFVQRPVGLA